MLDWSRIPDQNTFQNLVNHLFFLECPSSLGFIPFSPYIGKDGGWDGRYQGTYPPEDLDGTFCIQAKYTKHSLGSAMPSLRKWVRQELDKAIANKVDHLRLATCADLRNELIEELEKLNRNYVRTFKVWHRHDLELRIEQQPFLRFYYFGSPAIPLFVPASTYFREVERGLTDIAGDTLNKINAVRGRIGEIIKFLKNENERVFVIHAPGGYGKSHLLREFPLEASKAGIDREVWFIRDGVRDVREAINDEIGVREKPHQKHKYLFVVDDADRASDIRDILTCVLRSGVDAKLLLSLRTAGISTMRQTLDTSKCSNLATETRIPDWSNEELKILLRAAADREKIDNEDEIVRIFPNPFFIVRIGSNIRGKNDYDFHSTVRAILQSLRYDSQQALMSERTDVEDLLLNLTLIAPISITDRQSIHKIAQKLAVEERKVISMLEDLVRGGVLRQIGNILRFVPDMVGDVFLLEKMKSLSAKARKEVFLYWFSTHSKNVFCNLGATLKYGGDKDLLVPIVENVTSGWINNADEYENYEKRQILENLEEICDIVPDRALNLLWVFLGDQSLNTDAYGPIIGRLFRSDLDRRHLVNFVEELRTKVKQGMYANYRTSSLIKEATNPLHNDIERQIMPLLAIIEESLMSADPLIEFAKDALQEVLASSHQWTHSTYSGVQFGSSALKATDSVLAMRNRAISIVKTMLEDERAKVRAAGVEIAESIGKAFGGGVSNLPLKDCRLSILLTPSAQIELTPSGIHNSALRSIHLI